MCVCVALNTSHLWTTNQLLAVIFIRPWKCATLKANTELHYLFQSSKSYWTLMVFSLLESEVQEAGNNLTKRDTYSAQLPPVFPHKHANPSKFHFLSMSSFPFPFRIHQTTWSWLGRAVQGWWQVSKGPLALNCTGMW